MANKSVQSLGTAALAMLIAFHAIADPARSAPPKDPLPQVTVSAQREAIYPQVRRFVYEYLYLENDEGPTRWNSAVCPTVVGLQRDEGEYILQRLSQIARSAGVPLDGEQCNRPNLYVIATTHPAEVLRGWAKKTHWTIFADGWPKTMDAFIETPRPVRAWYNSVEVGTGNIPATVVPPGLNLGGDPAGLPARVFTRPGGGGSRITRDATWTLSSVIVVVDKTQIRAVPREQLADYISMLGFSRSKLNAPHGNAPTILGLFDDTPTAPPPPRMTAWDEALLEALYHTNPSMVQQSMLITSRMVDHIVPEAQADAPSSP